MNRNNKGAAGQEQPRISADVPDLLQQALTFHRRGQLDRAQEFYKEVLAQAPANFDALHLMGVLAAQRANPEAAVELIGRAITVNPRSAVAYSNLGAALHELRRYKDALESYERALAMQPHYPEVLNNRGVTLRALKRYEDALASYEGALRLRPDYVEARLNLGNELEALGRLDDALAAYRQALADKPDYAQAHHALICSMNRATADQAAIYAQCRAFAEQFERPEGWPAHQNARDPDRVLKIGYVSGDLRDHTVASFIEPILANHDAGVAAVFCYYNHSRRDAVTERLMRHGHKWRFIAHLPDDQVAALIQRDAIDILVDLSGHTAYNRLLTFAKKPAPVQVTWIGLPNTTGLKAMDYRLTNAQSALLGATERYHTETLYRLSGPSCFRPAAPPPPIGDLPALANGYVTFGSFNNVNKISPAAYRVWTRVLAALPTSRLLMVCDGYYRAHAQRQFTLHGITADRLVFYDKLPLVEYLALHNSVDIALDPMPYTGGSTTRYSLWMGVPVVSVAGATPVSRSGLALMSQVGLAAFAASTEDEYVEIASRWSGDLDMLASVRRSLRGWVQASFGDEKARTREVEAAYRVMWRAWCAE